MDSMEAVVRLLRRGSRFHLCSTKARTVLHLAGPAVQDIFDVLAETEGDKTVGALNAYFQPHVNIPYERHVSTDYITVGH